jgi:polyisoprenoid-binding protein YceI
MAPTTATAVRTYQIDKAHSEATFQVRHLLTKVRGRFSDFSGSIQFDEAHPEQSTVDFAVQTASIDTNEPDRDKHLRSADFFDVERHPAMTFRSSGVTPRSRRQFEVHGTLTIRGISKPMTLPVSYLGMAKDPWGVERAAFEAEITLNRKEFGLHWNAPLEAGGFLVGDDVHVSLSVQATAK